MTNDTKRVREWLLQAAAIVLFVILGALVLPINWGGWFQTTVVTGSSMEPTYHTGDIVVTWRTGDYSVGDIIVYHPQSLECERCNVVHRIIDENEDGTYVTQGDNNPVVDAWEPSSEEVIGREFAVVRLGNTAMWILNPWLWSLLLTFCALGALVLWAYEEFIASDDEEDDEKYKNNDDRNEG